MTKPILFFATAIILASCGPKSNPPQEDVQNPTQVVPEKVDGPAGLTDTLPPSVIPEAEKAVENTVEKPTKSATKPSKTTSDSKPVAKPAAKATLQGSWTLDKVYNAKEPFKRLFPNIAPDITFDLRNYTVNGKNGCNSYNGPFTLKNGVLKISDKLISTRMFCEGVSENLFMTTLQLTNGYKFDEKGNLLLTLDDENLMRFTAQ